MGRRTRNKVNEDKNTEEVEEEVDSEELTEAEIEQIEYERFEFAYNLRQKFLKFREDSALPLCEYLDMDSFMKFFDEVTQGE